MGSIVALDGHKLPSEFKHFRENSATSAQRRWWVNLFLLEEIVWHAKENSGGQFNTISSGLRSMLAEVLAWQQTQTAQ